MKKLSIIITLLLLTICSWCQAVFVSSGTITFERKINVRRQTDWEMAKEILEKQPQFHTSLFELSFSPGHSLYRPSEKIPDFQFNWILGPAKDNVISSDFQTSKGESIKKVFEQTFLIEDTLPQYKWRITDEKREIAGFSCRKAVTRIMDSVYVTAFYTDEITVTGGPESFHGLPGMILGLAIPRLYTTWFATKVSLEPSALPVVKSSGRKKKITNEEFGVQLQDVFKQWGKEGQRNMWWVFL